MLTYEAYQPRTTTRLRARFLEQMLSQDGPECRTDAPKGRVGSAILLLSAEPGADLHLVFTFYSGSLEGPNVPL